MSDTKQEPSEEFEIEIRHRIWDTGLVGEIGAERGPVMSEIIKCVWERQQRIAELEKAVAILWDSPHALRVQRDIFKEKLDIAIKSLEKMSEGPMNWARVKTLANDTLEKLK